MNTPSTLPKIEVSPLWRTFLTFSFLIWKGRKSRRLFKIERGPGVCPFYSTPRSWKSGHPPSSNTGNQLPLSLWSTNRVFPGVLYNAKGLSRDSVLLPSVQNNNFGGRWAYVFVNSLPRNDLPSLSPPRLPLHRSAPLLPSCTAKMK